MDTAGHIIKCSQDQPGSFDLFNSPDIVKTGNGLMEISNNTVTLTGANNIVFYPDIKHSFDTFNISCDIEIIPNYYDIEIGLIGVQQRWSSNTLVSIKSAGETTTISLHSAEGAIVRFTKNIPVLFTGMLQIRIVYSELCWKILLVNDDLTYTFTHKYNREIGNGHVTSSFALRCGVGPIVIKALSIEVPILTGGTLFIGDSITWGSTRPFGAVTFPERYANAHANVSVFASGSANSVDIVNSIEAINLLQPSKLFILIGDNDDYNDTAAFTYRITAILSALSPLVDQIYLFNLTPEISDTGYKALSNAVMAVAVPANVIKLDSWTALARVDNPDLVRPECVTDGVHLTQYGHDQIFSLIQSL